VKKSKILVITYYWPPLGGSGVQRWLKFVKFLPSFGWEPAVYTPENPAFDVRDPSLEKDVSPELQVVRTPIWEPYELFSKLTGAKKKKTSAADLIAAEKPSLTKRIFSWIRGNVFIPDPRMFWIRPSVRYLSRFIQENDIKRIVTTGPPHSMHLIGLALKKKFPDLFWVVDFRDPWTEWDLLETFQMTKWAKQRHARLERAVLQQADVVLTISPTYVEQLQRISGRAVNLITNGFDPGDFQAIQHTRTERFTIRHIGTADELRDPRPFMSALKSVLLENPEMAAMLRVEFIGNVNAAFKQWIKSDSVLDAVTMFISHMKHQELMKVYGETDLLLLVLAHSSNAQGNIPGKLFEYLASGIPIMALGKSGGDSDVILRESGCGQAFERSQLGEMSTEIKRHFLTWKDRKQVLETNVDKFSRKALTEKLVSLLR